MFLTLLLSLSGELFHADGVGVTEGLVDAGGHGHAEVPQQEDLRVVGRGAGEGGRALPDDGAEDVVRHGLQVADGVDDHRLLLRDARREEGQRRREGQVWGINLRLIRRLRMGWSCCGVGCVSLLQLSRA